MEQLINYKKRIASRYIPIEGGNAILDIHESEQFIYSEKLDGNIAYAVVTESNIEIYNRSAKKLDLTHLIEKLKGASNGIWAGELHLKQGRSRTFLVGSAIANDKTALDFSVFDAVHEIDKPIHDRIELVKKGIKTNDCIHIVNWQTTASRKELIVAYKNVIDAGGEGLIVHNALGFTFKIKPIIEIDATVIGYSLQEDGPGIRSLLVGLHNGKGWIPVASVGGGFTDDDRIDWVKKLEPLDCDSEIVMVASNKIAYKWIIPSIVIQIKCIEILTDDATGPIKKDVLTYDNKYYDSIGRVNSASLISPVLVGIRTDKLPNEDDTHFRQITERVEITSEIEDLSTYGDSEILFKSVYTKTSKTGTAIRKFVGIKTNKAATKKYPPYVLFCTDFSAGRKEPLQTEIKLAISEENLIQINNSTIEENIKKGWELV